MRRRGRGAGARARTGSSGTAASRTGRSRSRSSSPLAAAVASPSSPAAAPTPSPSQVMVKYLLGAEVHMVNLVMGTWRIPLIQNSGHLFVCGDGSFGQLGTGDNHSRSLPFEVASFTTKNVEKLAFGMRHSLVLLEDNSIYGFGSARRGQVGKYISRNEKLYNVPRIISGFPNCKIANIYANGDHSAALDESGQLYIWGRALVGEHDDDQPRAVFSSSSISQVALGWHHAIVLSAGELYTIGAYRHQKCDPPLSANAVMQQLNPTTARTTHDESFSSSNLEKVPSIHVEQVVQIAAGTEHSALVTDKGAVFTWGWGEHGQLGLGDTRDQVIPQRVNIGEKRSSCSASRAVYCGSGFTIAVDWA